MQDKVNKIKEIINELADYLLGKDADKTSYHDNYSEEDVMNALTIFNSISSNYGIKNGRIASEKDAEIFGNSMHNIVFNMTGIDTKKYFTTITKNK